MTLTWQRYHPADQLRRTQGDTVARELTYLDFDVLLERIGKSSRKYRARVINAPAGQTSPAAFTIPVTALELENFVLRIGRPRRVVRRVDAPETAAIKTFGGRLYRALFHDQLEVSLLRSLSEAAARGRGLRIRLRLSDTPELAELPWEFLYDQTRNRFLGLSDRTPLVRFLEVPDPPRPLTVSPPLQVLGMIASPSDYPQLDVEQEWTKLTTALAPLEQAGQVQVTRLEPASLAALRQQLRRADWHVLHFIGHGGFDPQTQDGVLVLEDQMGRSRLVSGQDLGVLLYDHDPLRLVVLNACEGARADPSDPFAGTAQSLILQGIPAVVAMQFEITDPAAITFASELYAAVADNYPLDAALAEARKAIWADGNQVEWATPVLHLRAPDGRIFSVLKPEVTKYTNNTTGEIPHLTEEAEKHAHPVRRIQARTQVARGQKEAQTTKTQAPTEAAHASDPHSATSVADQAITAAKKIRNKSKQVSALIEVARVLAQAGHMDQAASLVQQALTTVNKIRSDIGRMRALRDVAGGLAWAGHTDQALTIVKKIPDDPFRSIAMERVARALARAGQTDLAVSAVQAIRRKQDRASGLAEVAKELAKAGYADQATTVAAQALTTTRNLESWLKASVLSNVAEVAKELAKAGYADQATTVAAQALTIANKIPDGRYRATALSSVAMRLAEAGDLGQATTVAAQALTIAEKIPDDRGKAFALSGVAEVLAEAGDLDQATSIARQALTIANKIPDDTYNYYKGAALTAVAKVLAQAGDTDQATSIANTITPDSHRAAAVIAVPTVIAQAGHIDQALTIAKGIASDELKAFALSGVAEVLAEAGDLDQATSIARQALTIANKILDDGARASALTELAEVLALTGN